MKKHLVIMMLLASAVSFQMNAKTFADDFGTLSTEKLTSADLLNRSQDELQLMQSAIFAKYGFIFHNPAFTEYFSQFDWYEPATTSEMLVYSRMNPVEQYNVGRINLLKDGGEAISVYSYYGYPSELSYRRLSISDLYGLNCWELRVLRNAIYAKYGYIFKSDDLYYFFMECSWYRPRYKSESKVYGMMSKTEKANIDTIKKRERQLGC